MSGTGAKTDQRTTTGAIVTCNLPVKVPHPDHPEQFPLVYTTERRDFQRRVITFVDTKGNLVDHFYIRELIENETPISFTLGSITYLRVNEQQANKWNLTTEAAPFTFAEATSIRGTSKLAA